MAHIQKRSDTTYRITVCCGYDKQGKKLRKYKTVKLPETMTERQKEKEVQKQAALFEQKVENGTYLDGDKITFEDFINKWLADYAEKQLAPSTIKAYKTRLKERIIPALGHLKLSKIQPHHLLEFYNNLSEGGIRLDTYYKPHEALISIIKETPVYSIAKEIGIDPKTYSRVRKGERTNIEAAEKICNYFNQEFNNSFYTEDKKEKLSNKTIKHLHDLISAILSTAVEWNIISSNPAERVKTPKVTKSKSQYYDDIQVVKLFSILENEPMKYKVIIYLTIDTGLRLSEVAGLEWSDIDFDNNALEISKQRQYISGYGTFVKEPKTENGYRRISISDTVINLLKRYQTEQKVNKLKLGTKWKDNNYVFTHEDGSPMHPNRPYQWFQSFIDLHDLPKITFHSLRHTNASLLISEGIDIVTLSGRLGHADKNVTLNVYSHIIKSKEKQAANKMEDFYSRMQHDSIMEIQ